ncbi:MAG: sigma-70 family RNA polymerase sigma factor [Bacteroidota bacterium]
MPKLDSDIQLAQERAWISRAKENSEHFEPLYNKYFDAVYRYIFRRTDDEALAADLCSQTFYKALKGIGKYRWMGRPFGAWLFQIASNEVRKHFRGRTRVFVIEGERMEMVMESEVEDQTLLERLPQLLNELEEEDLRLIELKFFEDQTFKEIAELLGISESGAKMRTYRLLTRMRKLLLS